MENRADMIIQQPSNQIMSPDLHPLSGDSVTASFHAATYALWCSLRKGHKLVAFPQNKNKQKGDQTVFFFSKNDLLVREDNKRDPN